MSNALGEFVISARRALRTARRRALGMSKYDHIRFCALILSPWFLNESGDSEERDYDACWIWQGPRTHGGVRTRPTKPYGQFVFRHRVTGKRIWMKAHRITYAILRGDIPNDLVTGKALTMDHDPTCSTLCVNPWHEEPATNAANAAEANRRCKKAA